MLCHGMTWKDITYDIGITPCALVATWIIQLGRKVGTPGAYVDLADIYHLVRIKHIYQVSQLREIMSTLIYG